MGGFFLLKSSEPLSEGADFQDEYRDKQSERGTEAGIANEMSAGADPLHSN